MNNDYGDDTTRNDDDHDNESLYKLRYVTQIYTQMSYK